MLACSVLTGLGFLLKAPCMGNYEDNRNRYLCVNDIQVLYVNGGTDDGTFPYIQAIWSTESCATVRSSTRC